MNAEQLKEWASALTVPEIYAEAVVRMAVLDASGGHGIPLDAYNAIVDMGYLLDAALALLGHEDSK